MPQLINRSQSGSIFQSRLPKPCAATPRDPSPPAAAASLIVTNSSPRLLQVKVQRTFIFPEPLVAWAAVDPDPVDPNQDPPPTLHAQFHAGFVGSLAYVSPTAAGPTVTWKV
jgi:hypothetical protein